MGNFRIKLKRRRGIPSFSVLRGENPNIFSSYINVPTIIPDGEDDELREDMSLELREDGTDEARESLGGGTTYYILGF